MALKKNQQPILPSISQMQKKTSLLSLNQDNTDETSYIRELPISELDNFEGNRFPVIDDAPDMLDLITSIKENGVLEPVIVFKKEDGRYQLVSGHRRKRACELLGKETIPCDIRPAMDYDHMIIICNHANIYRPNIPISVKALSLKDEWDAITRLRERGEGHEFDDVTDEEPSSTATEKALKKTEETKTQLFRYLRIASLNKDLLTLVDSEKIPFTCAVEISYINEKCQQRLFEILHDSGKKLSLANAKRLHARENTSHGLSPRDVEIFLTNPQRRRRPSQEKAFVPSQKIRSLIPDSVNKNDIEEYVCAALLAYQAKEREQEDIFEAYADQPSETENIETIVKPNFNRPPRV